MPIMADGLVFLVLFGLSFALFHIINGCVVGSSIEFGKIANIVVAVICGAITGLIISGCVLVAFNLASLPSKFSYKRFDDTITRSEINDPGKSFLGADDFVAGLFGWMSKGSMSGKRSFSFYHSDFNSQIHLNKHLLGEKVIPVSASNAVSIPKLGVRKKETDDGKSYTLIRVEINGAKIDKGGATNKGGFFSFAPFQMRLICQSGDGANAANVKVLYPQSIRRYNGKGKPFKEIGESKFGATIKLESDDFVKSGSKRLAVMDIAFDVPSNLKPVLFEFKNSSVTEVPAISRDEDTEEKLKEIFKPEK